jgi:hypothetical protein
MLSRQELIVIEVQQVFALSGKAQLKPPLARLRTCDGLEGLGVVTQLSADPLIHCQRNLFGNLLSSSSAKFSRLIGSSVFKNRLELLAGLEYS